MIVAVRFSNPPKIQALTGKDLNPWQYLTENNTFSHERKHAKQFDTDQQGFDEASRLKMAFPNIEVTVFASSLINQ